MATTKSFPSKALLSHPLLHPVMLLSGTLWLMVWGTYNAEIWQLFEPGFPKNALDLFHGARTLLPFFAAYLGVIMFLARSSLSVWPLRGPLGMLSIYALVGTISSLLLSTDRLTALYWNALYGSVPLVLWAIMVNFSSPSSLIKRLIDLNWFIAIAIMVSLLIVLLMQPGTLSQITSAPFAAGRPFGGFGMPVGAEIFGMVGTRPTGFGRYAGISALVALAKLWQSTTVRSKIVWFLLLLVSLFALILSQARTAVLSFLAGALVLLWLRSRSKVFLIMGILLIAGLLSMLGFPQIFWNYLLMGKTFDPTLSGRVTGTWQEGWRLFLGSPLLGFGFHVDRIFLEQHMHNALLHALVQTGLLGTIPFVAALVITWVLIVRLYHNQAFRRRNSLPLDVPAVMTFFTVSSITESTFAFFGVAWLICAPIFAYVYTMHRRPTNQYQKPT